MVWIGGKWCRRFVGDTDLVPVRAVQVSLPKGKDKNVTYGRACELRMQLRLDVDALLAQAEASDREDTDPQALPKERGGKNSSAKWTPPARSSKRGPRRANPYHPQIGGTIPPNPHHARPLPA